MVLQFVLATTFALPLIFKVPEAFIAVALTPVAVVLILPPLIIRLLELSF